MRNDRGTPSVNRLVLASWRGKLSVMISILPVPRARRLATMTSDSAISGRRLLLVHAHPDDESIGTGATMARYAAEGAQVTLVTCTLGELGEIIPPSLSFLAEGDQRGGGRLGQYRIGELNAACAELGVTDHRFLGGPGRWRDSGMRSEEHTSELQSRRDLVCRLLLEKKKKSTRRATRLSSQDSISRTHR